MHHCLKAGSFTLTGDLPITDQKLAATQPAALRHPPYGPLAALPPCCVHSKGPGSQKDEVSTVGYACALLPKAGKTQHAEPKPHLYYFIFRREEEGALCGWTMILAKDLPGI